MDNKNHQKKRLISIFKEAAFAPIFKHHPTYCIDRFAELTPYISYDDVVDNKFSIRGCPIGSGNSFDSGEREIIIEYATIDELLDDGWQLD